MNHYAIYPKLTQYCKSTILQKKKKSPEYIIKHPSHAQIREELL